jgi:DNA transformation protein
MGAVDNSFVGYVLDQLSRMEGLGCRAMFGGHGLYHGATFFGIVFDGRLFLKTDDSTAGEYVRRGMEPFHPNDRQTLKTYYEVPADVLESQERLLAWARAAARCAASARRSSSTGRACVP